MPVLHAIMGIYIRESPHGVPELESAKDCDKWEA
jgi:hypothetical protein